MATPQQALVRVVIDAIDPAFAAAKRPSNTAACATAGMSTAGSPRTKSLSSIEGFICTSKCT